MKHQIGSPDLLYEREDNWETDLGAWFPGEKVILRGKDLLNDLADRSWIDIWYFSITGKEFTEKQLALWNGLWVLCSSFPEPRIWTNRVASLTGSAKSTSTLAVSAATAVSEAKIYGRQADYGAFHFITSLKKKVSAGSDLQNELDYLVKKKRVVPTGYGRPIISVDERIPPVMQLVSRLGFDSGGHYNLALEVQDYFENNNYPFRLNVGGVSAALSADQGLTIDEYIRIATVVFTAGNAACYADAADHREGTFFPLSCQRISYKGQPARKWRM